MHDTENIQNRYKNIFSYNGHPLLRRVCSILERSAKPPSLSHSEQGKIVLNIKVIAEAANDHLGQTIKISMRNTDSIRSRVSSQRSMKSCWWGGTFGLLTSLLLAGASGQVIGIDTCACSPSTYEFVFDFTLFCPPVNITLGDAVSSTSCSVGPFGSQDVTDLIPVSVQSVDVVELGQDLRVLVVESLTGNFVDGDSFRHESIANLPGEITSPLEIPSKSDSTQCCRC